MRVFLITYVRTPDGQIGAGIVERVNHETIWIASIYETNTSNSQALDIICRYISNELKEEENAEIILFSHSYFSQIKRARRHFPRYIIKFTARRHRESYFLAMDALERKFTIIERL